MNERSTLGTCRCPMVVTVTSSMCVLPIRQLSEERQCRTRLTRSSTCTSTPRSTHPPCPPHPRAGGISAHRSAALVMMVTVTRRRRVKRHGHRHGVPPPSLRPAAFMHTQHLLDKCVSPLSTLAGRSKLSLSATISPRGISQPKRDSQPTRQLSA